MSRMLAPMGANVGSGDSGWRRFVGLGSAADDLTSKTAASASLFSTAALLFRASLRRVTTPVRANR